MQGRGGEELSTELSTALERSLLGGKSGAGIGKENPHFCLTKSTFLLLGMFPAIDVNVALMHLSS